MNKSQTNQQSCQLVLAFDVTRDVSDDFISEVIHKTPLAAVIFYSKGADDTILQNRASQLIDPLQTQNIAALVAGDRRIAARIGADGIHREESRDFLDGRVDNKQQDDKSMILGYGNIKERHVAMEIGEKGANYVMFGKLGADMTPRPHPRNLRLASWWASVIEVPCLVQAGTDIDSVVEAAQTGAEFVVVEEMIFAATNASATLHQITHLLENTSPRAFFEKVDIDFSQKNVIK